MLRRTEHDNHRTLFRAGYADRNGNPVDSHMCPGHFVKLLALSLPREFSSPLSVPAQPARIFAVCLATTSKKVCGSEALTAMLGSGVGKAIPNKPRFPTFWNTM